MATPISRLRRLRRTWPIRLLLFFVFVGLLAGSGLRSTPHSHDAHEMGSAHHFLLTIEHEAPPDIPEEDASVVTHFHYSASWAYVDASSPALVQAGFQPIGVLRVTEGLTPTSRDAEAQHRPPIG